MDEIKIFRVASNNELWFQKVIEQYNQENQTDFKIINVLDDEVVFLEISTTKSLEHIFDFAKNVEQLRAIEVIEGRFI